MKEGNFETCCEVEITELTTNTSFPSFPAKPLGFTHPIQLTTSDCQIESVLGKVRLKKKIESTKIRDSDYFFSI
jgi:hypothetical protein